MGLFNKKDVPDELPELAIDEIRNKSREISNSNEDISSFSSSENQKISNSDNFSKKIGGKPLPSSSNKSESINNITNQINNSFSEKDVFLSKKEEDSFSNKLLNFKQEELDDNGYFKEVIDAVTTELEDINKFEDWYKDKFVTEDVVTQMKEYWSNQKPEKILLRIKGELRDKLLEGTKRMHKLEKEWQEIYFTLLSKEEEIRKGESELKKTIAEFVDSYKRMVGNDKLKGKKGKRRLPRK